MSDLKLLVGKRIRALRKAKGLSQATLAERAGSVSDSYLAGIERGERNISLESLEKIVTALDAEPIDAFRFGELELGKGLEEKRLSLRVLSSFLEERSIEEIELIRKMAKDVMATIDAEKRKSN
ncbi:helix-turn-helix domain-containing protein [Paenibacillus alginolyticus]|uniref:helix-turn-helix domain-containing protein n=1 Tax=Paenibacillus alginolyticus TaxID=59839 RepID=UPI00041077E1|nr:helix-turn-helix transcriptional regulator [Paenibacillus alginolyticus]MCY9664899.1 helix-turn-helix domain-containing protein [Paenibacillus alginolyticus]